MKAAIYGRVSTVKQESENQLFELRDFCRKQGWELCFEFVDTVTGSGKKTRTQFDKMMLAASQKQFDVLLFWKLDRLSREGVRKTLAHLTRLDAWGVAWRSYTEAYFDSCGPFKDAVIAIMATLAQQERIAISERTKAGLQRAVRQGKTLGRRRVVVDVGRARKLQESGLGLRPVAKKLHVSVNTLRQALAQS